MLELKNISWEIPDGDKILKGIDLEIPDGKMTVITGPNGGGKTSLAKIIAGLEVPNSGEILLDGENITDWDITKRAKNGIAYAFQQPVRFKGITVRGNMKIFYKKMQKLFVSAFQIILRQNVALNLHRFHAVHSVAVKKHFRHSVPVEYRSYFLQNHLIYSDLSVH